MIGHYTAAAMASDNKRLAVPASVDSLPTSGMQEDHVSMAWNSVRKLRRLIDNVRRIIAVELVVAAGRSSCERRSNRARPPALRSGVLRDRVPGPGPDRFLAPELAAAESAPARHRPRRGARRRRHRPRLIEPRITRPALGDDSTSLHSPGAEEGRLTQDRSDRRDVQTRSHRWLDFHASEAHTSNVVRFNEQRSEYRRLTGNRA